MGKRRNKASRKDKEEAPESKISAEEGTVDFFKVLIFPPSFSFLCLTKCSYFVVSHNALCVFEPVHSKKGMCTLLLRNTSKLLTFIHRFF